MPSYTHEAVRANPSSLLNKALLPPDRGGVHAMDRTLSPFPTRWTRGMSPRDMSSPDSEAFPAILSNRRVILAPYSMGTGKDMLAQQSLNAAIHLRALGGESLCSASDLAPEAQRRRDPAFCQAVVATAYPLSPRSLRSIVPDRYSRD